MLQEQVQRLIFEAKVVKLEEENQELKENRNKASKQLQSFADKFYLATEDITLNIISSQSPSPELIRTMSRRNSVSSNESYCSRDSTGLRSSDISVTSQS